MILSGCIATPEISSYMRCDKFLSTNWTFIKNDDLMNELLNLNNNTQSLPDRLSYLFKSDSGELGVCEVPKVKLKHSYKECGNSYRIFKLVDELWKENDTSAFIICG